MRVSLIAAIATNQGIGKDNTLMWHCPSDLKRFKDLTMGKPVIMGRNTWESLPEKVRPLPGRLNIIISRTMPVGVDANGVVIVNSLDAALKHVSATEQGFAPDEVFIIGGGELYKFALDGDMVDRMHLTFVDHTGDGADAFFPYWHRSAWVEVESNVNYSDRSMYKVLDKRILKDD